MPIEFLVVGLLFIYVLFYFDLKIAKNILLLISLFCIICGYFFGIIIINNVSFNLMFVLSFVFIIVAFSIAISKKERKLAVESALICSIVYFAFNIISINFNMMFSSLFIIAILLILTICEAKLDVCVLQSAICLVLVEIFNVFYLLPRLESVLVFNGGLWLVMAVVVAINLIRLLLLKRSKKYEKIG